MGGKDNLNAFHKSIVGKLKPGLYKISSAKFRILGGHAYFLPNHTVAKRILTKIEDNSKPRAVDHEFVDLQDTLMCYFWFPAIALLHMPDACSGWSRSGMIRDFLVY